jgi:hypothetical protein
MPPHLPFAIPAGIGSIGCGERSFDDLVGAGEDCWRDREAEFLRGLEIDDQLEFGRLLHGQIRGFDAIGCYE